MSRSTLALTILSLAALSATDVFGASLVASYSFNNSLAADSGSAPNLVSIDPLNKNSFETAIVNGVTQTVFRWSGDGSSPTLHAGLSLDATGLVAYDNYSVELRFEFLDQAAFGSGWRRIIDTQNRQSDNGFYVSPQNTLQVYPVVSGSTTYTTPGFHDVVLTNFVVNGVREVKAYLDGNLELVSNTDQLNLDNSNNPGHLLYFFADNLAGPAQLEFADGRIASLKLYDGVITVPVPAALWLFSSALVGLGAIGKTRNTKRTNDSAV
ncbi:MAG: hypothetical protein WCP96_17525 [Methylococcaceae bacterium]